jgi:hypothetical protein
MKLRLFLVMFLLIAVALLGKQSSPVPHQNWSSYRGTGGPDAYGYTWIDSDEPGGPTYSWIDISTIGTEITGLTDDNNVGPFAMNFDFPYYWYTVNSFYVNANGAIAFFPESDVYVPQGASGFFIPSSNAPNDLLIPLGADLTFETGPPARCYYYTNNVDTLIVSFIRVPAWVSGPPSGEHTFQIICTAADSNIYFQYGDQQGQFYSGACCGGFENVIGNVGLQVFLNINPNSLIDYAVQIIPPDSTTYQALDIGVVDALSENSEGVFFFPGDYYALSTKVRNYGNVDAGSFEVRIQLWDTSYVSHFTDTVVVAGLVAGAETTIYFTPNWTPPSVDDYLAFIQTQLGGDINPTNNSKDVEIEAITLPGWMQYDSDPGSASGYSWIGAGGGWGQEFEPPQYPIVIDSVSLAMMTSNSVYVPMYFMDDDGSGGGPGTILHADSMYITPQSGFLHYKFYIPPSAGTITDGKFYVGMVQRGDSFPRIMMEDAGPFSRRGWELTGSWSPSRERETFEVMIRAHSNSAQAVGEDKGSKSYAFSLLPVRPNPVSGPTQIYYMLPGECDVSLKVYNLLGQEVVTLVDEHKAAGVHSATFNNDGLPQGVYFYRLTAGEQSLTRRLILLK